MYYGKNEPEYGIGWQRTAGDYGDQFGDQCPVAGAACSALREKITTSLPLSWDNKIEPSSQLPGITYRRGVIGN